MEVKIVSITQSLIPGIDSPEDLIVYEARVSNPDNQMNTLTAMGLLKYLIKKNHWSPIDMVDMTIEVKTSRAIAQQILRHWSFRFQEFSQRYAEVVDMEEVQIREAGSTTRQGSKEGEFDPKIKVDTGNDIVPYSHASDAIVDHLQYCQNLYHGLLEAGVAKECARMVLPLTTQTTLYMKGSARSWFHYFQQRLDKHAQLEHRQVAQEAFLLFGFYFPNLAQLINYDKDNI